MHHGWNSKRKVEETYKLQDLPNTHSHLFVKKENTSQPIRAAKLVSEEQKGRPDNPITGAIHYNS